jgi:gliding motility-associated-like protein
MQENSSSDVISWQWDSPESSNTSSSIQNPSFIFPEGIIGDYPITLYVTTELGCTDSVVTILNVISEVIMYAPNAFTPDGDSHNQTWKIHIQGIDETSFHLLIFNRWGEIIWETKDVNSEWDGTYKGQPVNDGFYNWTATAKDLYTDKKIPFVGSISLLK